MDTHWRTTAKLSMAVWSYLAVNNKMVRSFPAAPFRKDYDPQSRMWYKMVVQAPGRIAVTRPYLDASGAGYVVTISQALFAPRVRNGKPGRILFGVMAIDVSIEYIYSALIGIYPPCTYTHGMKCILLDHAGYIVAYDGMMKAPRDKWHEPLIENVHITRVEGEIAAHLIKRGFMNKTSCIDIAHRTEFVTYKMTDGISVGKDDIGAADVGFRIFHVAKTNIFVITKNDNMKKKEDACVCSFWESSIPSLCLEQPKSECECPCYRYKTFRPSRYTHGWDGNVTQCPPIRFFYKVINNEMMYVDTLKPCFQPKCGARKEEYVCHRQIGCRWCSVGETGDDLREPFCSRVEDCYFGFVGHPGPNIQRPRETQRPWLVIALFVFVQLAVLVIILTVLYKTNISSVHKGDSVSENLHIPVHGSMQMPLSRSSPRRNTVVVTDHTEPWSETGLAGGMDGRRERYRHVMRTSSSTHPDEDHLSYSSSRAAISLRYSYARSHHPSSAIGRMARQAQASDERRYTASAGISKKRSIKRIPRTSTERYCKQSSSVSTEHCHSPANSKD